MLPEKNLEQETQENLLESALHKVDKGVQAKKNKIWIIFLIILNIGFIIIGCALWLVSRKTNQKQTTENSSIQTSKISKTNEIKIPENWKVFRNDVLGIEFSYPEDKWGKPFTEPTNITKLEGLVDKYEEDNSFFNSLFIKFPNDVFGMNNNISIRIFNDKYQGEHYKNGRTYDLGYQDNIPDLKQSGDICTYKIEFTKKWEEKSSNREFYSDCANNVKTFITEDDEFFDFDNIGQRYSYSLFLAGYKKLDNGYFDNALILERVDYISQIKERIAGFENFFNYDHSYQKDKRITLSKEEFEEKKKDFTIFVNSIKIFKPVKKVAKPFENKENEDKNITLIRKYYWLIENGHLAEAFAMKRGGGSFDEFVSFYKNVFQAEPFEFQNKSMGIYDFLVNYQDHNEPREKYHVIMKVDDEGMITTLLSERYLVENVVFGDMIAYAANRNKKNLVVLRRNGEEIIVDQAGDCYENYEDGSKCEHTLGDTLFYWKIEFSPKGNYLVYTGSGWEWIETKVYDVKNNKVVNLTDDQTVASENFYFTPDEKFAYYCAAPGMGSGGAEIFKVPGFEKIADIFQEQKAKDAFKNDFYDLNCYFDEAKKEIVFTFSRKTYQNVVDIGEEIRFSLENNKVIK